MKPMITAAFVAALLTGTSAPVVSAAVSFDTLPAFDLLIGATEFDRRGRSKPRVPGGSGCDDPRDLIEHPECRI